MCSFCPLYPCRPVLNQFKSAAHIAGEITTPQLSEPAELLLELRGALELPPRLKGCSSCLSTFFHPRFAKGKKNTLACLLLHLFGYGAGKKKKSLLNSFNQMSAEPLSCAGGIIT